MTIHGNQAKIIIVFGRAQQLYLSLEYRELCFAHTIFG